MTAAPGMPARRAVLVVAVAVAMTIAGGLGTLLVLEQQKGGSSPAVVNDGPTFYQALGKLNASVHATPGGPWTLYTVYGVATPVPFSPSALGWFEQNRTVNSCGALFNGLTLWNGSIPLFNGTLNSGTAPFWQFFYFSNASQSILIATDVLGQTRVFPPAPMSNLCFAGSSLNYDPLGWARVFDPFPADSPTLSSSAVNALGAGWFVSNPSVYEAYRFGNNYWGSGNPAGLVIDFERCGEVGRAGVQPKASVGVSSTGKFVTSFVGAEGCGNLESFGSPDVFFSYELGIASPTSLTTGGSTYITIPFQALLTNSSGTIGTDASGIVSWMVRLNLTSGTGAALPGAGSSCEEWVPTTSDCVANSTGWFAILQSPSGAWLDSYGASEMGMNWSVPDVSLVSDQQLVVVVPSSWNLTGDLLSVTSTTSNATISGSTTI